jgi:hypothetical protein
MPLKMLGVSLRSSILNNRIMNNHIVKAEETEEQEK